MSTIEDTVRIVEAMMDAWFLALTDDKPANRRTTEFYAGGVRFARELLAALDETRLYSEGVQDTRREAMEQVELSRERQPLSTGRRFPQPMDGGSKP